MGTSNTTAAGSLNGSLSVGRTTRNEQPKKTSEAPKPIFGGGVVGASPGLSSYIQSNVNQKMNSGGGGSTATVKNPVITPKRSSITDLTPQPMADNTSSGAVSSANDKPDLFTTAKKAGGEGGSGGGGDGGKVLFAFKTPRAGGDGEMKGGGSGRKDVSSR